MMKKLVLLYLILLLVTAPQAVAGVVEDAEEQIKKLRKENRGHTQPHRVPNYPAPAPSQNPSSTDSRQTPARSTQPQEGSKVSVSGGSQATAAAIRVSEDVEKPRRPRVSKPRDKGDKLLSIFGILILLLLIGAGTMFGKRRESAR